MNYRTHDAAREAIFRHIMDALRVAKNPKEFRVALLTRDAVEDMLVKEVISFFFKHLKKKLLERDSDMNFFDKGFINGERQGHIFYHRREWPKGLGLALEFDKKHYRDLFIGINKPDINSTECEHDVGNSMNRSLSDADMRGLHEATRKSLLFNGNGAYSSNWICWSWMSEPLNNARSTEALLILAGAEKFKGRNFVDYIADEFVGLRRLVDEALRPILKG